MKTITTSIILAIAALGAGCSSSEEGTGVLQLSAAAPPAEDAPIAVGPVTLADPHLTLAVKQIDVHIAAEGDAERGLAGGEAGETLGSDEEEIEAGGWLTVAAGVELDLRPGDNHIDLGEAVVPAGKLTQVRLVLDRDVTLRDGADTILVPCPSCLTSGLKLVVDDHAEIPEGGEAQLTLMFDLEATALQIGAGSKLGPVIHAQASAGAPAQP